LAAPIAALTARTTIMIWMSDARGHTTYMCAEWYAFTGQQPPAALGSGWVSAIHPEDQLLMEEVFQQACETRCQFALQYRLRRHDGTYVWVTDSAAPSWAPGQEAFLGFLGQISPSTERQGQIAKAELHAFEATTPIGEFAAATTLDAIADHVLMARALAVASAADHLLAPIDELLGIVGHDLARHDVHGDMADSIN
jgi:PAS domain S-box-containing protein